MAKINVTADTSTGELTCSVDGVNLDNVAYVSLSSYCCDMNGGNKYNVSFSAETKRTETGTHMCVYAQDLTQDSAKAAVKAGTAKFLSEDKQIVSFPKASAIVESVRKWLKR